MNAWDELLRKVEALPEPTLGMKGGVSRKEVIRLIREMRDQGVRVNVAVNVRHNPTPEPLILRPGEMTRGRYQ